MNLLSRLIHRMKGRHYAHLAAQLQHNLTEYVLTEENRITICLHRAGWHFARSKPQAPLPPHEAVIPMALTSTPRINGHPLPSPSAKFLTRSVDGVSDDKASF